jgi:hypothetical protein
VAFPCRIPAFDQPDDMAVVGGAKLQLYDVQRTDSAGFSRRRLIWRERQDARLRSRSPSPRTVGSSLIRSTSVCSTSRAAARLRRASWAEIAGADHDVSGACAA